MEDLKKHYQDLYKQFGYSPKSLGWDKGKQFLRFHQLTNGFNLNNASIFDVGCGFGDFVKYLELNKVSNYKYLGIDIVEDFIQQARKIHTGDNIDFVKSDFLELDLESNFDYGIASGTFNLAIEGVDGYDNIERNMTKMFNSCNQAISIDLLTSRVDYTHEHNFNSDPLKILEIAFGLSKSVVLQNNYFPFEFCITIYKDDSFRRETTIFSKIEQAFSWLEK